jgi:hypothetical protein
MAIGLRLFLHGQLSWAQPRAFGGGQKWQNQFNRNGHDGFSVVGQFDVIVKTFPSAVGAANGQTPAIGAFDQKNSIAGR